MRPLSDEEMARIGDYLAEVFQLKHSGKDRWKLGAGYLDKSSIGVCAVLMDIARRIEDRSIFEETRHSERVEI